MNKIYLIANWKMQLLNSEAESLTTETLKHLNTETLKHLELILCPTFTALSKVGEIIKNYPLSNIQYPISLGAQNVFYYEKGSYTGEVSARQLGELGVDYVIVGHSERRQYLNETDEDVNRKVNICLDNDLIPIICVGETFEQRQIGKTDLILITQITKALQGIELNTLKVTKKLIIAYEPVWVIGTGQAVNHKDAQHVAQVIKHTLLDFFDKDTIEKDISIIYGGSVDKDNVMDFIRPKLIDGVLVGGASLSKEIFLPLIERLTNKTQGKYD